jgi:hypothetical protein
LKSARPRRIRRRLFVAVLMTLPTIGALGWRWLRLRGPAVDGAAPRLLTHATEAIVALPIDSQLYEQYFRWRLEHLRPARLLYARFLKALASESKAAGVDFLAAEPDARRTVLARVSQRGDMSGAWPKLRGEMLALFARTDAWLQLGYESWPGTARGFANLDRLPARLPL